MRSGVFQFAVLLVVAAALTGCRTTHVSSGLPPDAKKVGGGKGFTYITPADGEMFIVRNGKVEMMRWLTKDTKFEAIGPVPWANPADDFSAFEYFFKPTRMATPDK